MHQYCSSTDTSQSRCVDKEIPVQTKVLGKGLLFLIAKHDWNPVSDVVWDVLGVALKNFKKTKKQTNKNQGSTSYSAHCKHFTFG